MTAKTPRFARYPPAPTITNLIGCANVKFPAPSTPQSRARGGASPGSPRTTPPVSSRRSQRSRGRGSRSAARSGSAGAHFRRRPRERRAGPGELRRESGRGDDRVELFLAAVTEHDAPFSEPLDVRTDVNPSALELMQEADIDHSRTPRRERPPLGLGEAVFAQVAGPDPPEHRADRVEQTRRREGCERESE